MRLNAFWREYFELHPAYGSSHELNQLRDAYDAEKYRGIRIVNRSNTVSYAKPGHINQ